MHRLRERSLIRPALGLAATITLAGGLVLASAGPVRAHAADGHPARIQKGPCSALGQVVFQLNGVGASVYPDGTPIPMGTPGGPETAKTLDLSVTTIDAKLADVVAGGHAITLYESDEDMGSPMACGDIGGRTVGDGLAVEISPVGGGSDTGVAILHADGDKTTVSIALIEGEAGAAATPAAGT